ncbi:MAG: GGDEF domain-containing protein [Lachnospiraceae bacterium]|nr:GGDEF domain-containing protein [Candidatus Colinaster equi]
MYIYNYLVAALSQMVLVPFIWHSAYMDSRKNKLFITSIFFNIITLLGYAGRSIVNDGNHFILNYLINFVIYISACLLSYFFLLTSIKKNGIIYKIVSVWESILILYIVTTPWTHLAFYIDENNIYTRGSLYELMFISQGAFMLLWVGVLAVIYRNVEFKRRIYVYLLGILEFAAIILQMHASDFKVIYVAAAFFLEIYYVFMMEVEGRYDQMTGVFSKRFYYSEIERLSPNNTYLVFLSDLNRLKYINDNLGHEYGDLAITAVGKSTWDIMHSKAKIFRIGGDEFVGISKSIEEKEMHECIDAINARLIDESKKLGYDVTVSVGYAIHTLGEEFQSTLQKADENMYIAKNEYYEKNHINRRE